jgi:cobalt-zinc-cadmium efflux system membrane fusion protein
LLQVQTWIVTVIVVAAVGLGVILIEGGREADKPATQAVELSSQSKRGLRQNLTQAQLASLTIEPVVARVFRPELVTEGKIAIDEDRSTPVYSPYPGRVTRLLVKAGDDVAAGQKLFMIEAADMVQAQNDFLTASAGVNKARSRLSIAQTIDSQNARLYESRAVALREVQQAQADLAQARSELASAEAALEAARNRLRILGKTDAEIAEFQQKGTISPETPIVAPIAGTVVQRKVGPGQYVSYTSIGSVDPVFTIGNLSTVWLVAYVRESEAPKVRVGQQIEFTALAFPGQVFRSNLTYVSTSLDPSSRRLLVRATIENSNGAFKPEMFANVTIFTEEGDSWPAVPRGAVIYDGDSARVWVMRDDQSIELRPVKIGVGSKDKLQVLEGLKAGDRVVTKGGIFVDKAAGS